MSYDNIQYDVRSSLLKMCKDFITQNSLTGYEVFDFDAHAGVNDLPNNHLIGIAEYSLGEMSDTYEGECMVIICTKQDDTNLKELYPNTSKMFARLKAGRTIPVVQSDDGVVIGNLKVHSGTEAMSVARTKARPLQAINISFGLSLVLPP